MSQDSPEFERLHASILAVDDDALIRVQLQRMLSRIVTEVHIAADGSEGLALWTELQPDLVITDVMMPVMDGLEMSRQIKELDPEAQIIVVSSSAEVDHLRQALDIGIDRYVTKPLDARLMSDAVSKCLRDSQRLRELRISRLVFDAASEGVIVTDSGGRIIAVNPAFCEITGYRAEEALGRRPTMLSSGHHDTEFYQQMWTSLRSFGRWTGEVINRRKSGEVFPEWLSIVAVEEPFKRATCYVGLFSDISERKREEDRIRRLAHYDVLTGLPNRTLFGDHVRRTLARMYRLGGQLALLYLDLDRFKPVNDLYGHAVGDLVLAEAARRMASAMRDTDTVSRCGGDEFVASLESEDAKETAALVSRKLIEAVSRPYEVEGHQLSIGVSIGIAIYPDDGEDADTLLAAADSALYAAKASGRGNFRFSSSEDQQDFQQRSILDGALCLGLAEDRFEPRFLPEISLHTGEVEQLETLLRFRLPNGELLNARHFVAHAEKLRITPDIGMRTLDKAARAIAALALPRPGLSLDLSPLQLAGMVDVEPVIDLLHDHGIPLDSVTFEFPESVVTGNPTGQDNLHALAAKGVKFALDDFGAGFCSFSLLQQLPLSAIKIDMYFVQEIETNPQSRELVAALIAFGRRLGIRTVAEGVDSPGQLAFLRENGCDAVQGFLFGLPLSASELAPYLRDRAWRAWFEQGRIQNSGEKGKVVLSF